MIVKLAIILFNETIELIITLINKLQCNYVIINYYEKIIEIIIINY